VNPFRSWLGTLNFVLLQWFCVRLELAICIETGDVVDRSASHRLVDGLHLALGRPVTQVRLAYSGPAYALRTGLGPRPGLATIDKPSVLVAYPYLDQWQKNRHDYDIHDWAMDSGAFSAFHSGKEIDLQQFIDTSLKLLEEDDQLVEVFGLDVINDWEAGMRNVEEMWRQGVPAIPTYHAGEPEELLLEIAKTYPKIAISGTGGKKWHKSTLIKFYKECFARIWPCKVHGFAAVDVNLIRELPFHSVDSSTWESQVTKWAAWRTKKGTGKNKKVSIRGSEHHLRDEVDWYLREERAARARWRKQLKEMEAASSERTGPVFESGEDDDGTAGGAEAAHV